MKHQIDIYNKTKIKIEKIFLKNITQVSLDSLKTNKPCEISLFLVDKKFIKELNRNFRGVNFPTDVLAFSIFNKEHKSIDLPDNILHLGDVVICLPITKKQASKNKQPFKLELAILLIHGILHLFGYNHNNKKHKNKMDFVSQKILRILTNNKIINKTSNYEKIN